MAGVIPGVQVLTEKVGEAAMSSDKESAACIVVCCYVSVHF